MEEIIKERETTGFEVLQYLISFLFCVLDIFLISRLVLKLLGANALNTFVSFIYRLTEIFISPFVGILHNWVITQISTISIMESATIIAIIVYAALAWGVVRIIALISGEPVVS
jgi:hypothetical protein